MHSLIDCQVVFISDFFTMEKCGGWSNFFAMQYDKYQIHNDFA